MRVNTKENFGRNFIWPAIFSLVLAACAADRPADYREAYPLVVGGETLSLSLDVPLGKETLPADEIDGFRRFVLDFVNRGRGAMVVETASSGNVELGLARVRWVKKLLREAGVLPREIMVRQGDAPDQENGVVVLTYSANAVQVPECGDWSAHEAFNPSNRRTTNFGCSVQRNIGLTVADPGDLKRAKTMTSRPPDRVLGVITGHRAGTPTGAAHSTGSSE